MELEDQEALFHSYPCALYYVQSPSSISHANSNNNEFNSAYPSHVTHDPVSRLAALSRYSSSRGSNNSFLHEKKIVFDVQSQENATENGERSLRDIIVKDVIDDDVDDEDGDDDEVYFGRRKRSGWYRRYFSFGTSSSCLWFSLQISWRLIVSLGAALLVFYLATKPPLPEVSVKIASVRQFRLGEGVDDTGIPTKILTGNCSMDLVIENKSKIFRLHIQSPLVEMSFGHLPFAISRGPKLYAESYSSTTFKLYVGTKNKPLYGAGRTMQDMLESGHGLPLVIHLSFRSSFHVVWNLIKPKFHHQAQCLVVLGTIFDNKRRTQVYNSTCTITPKS